MRKGISMGKGRLMITNGNIVTEDGVIKGDILVDNGKIVGIASSITTEAVRINANGMFVFPGFIDTHTHFDMPLGDITTADNFDSGTRAALLGGTTTVLDFATQEGDMTLGDALSVWQKKAEGAHCNYGFHMAVSRADAQTLEEIADMAEKGVTSFKLYMAYPNLCLSDREIFEVLCKVKEIGGVAGVHCENGALADVLTERLLASGRREVKYHALARPDDIEAEAIDRLAAIARLANAHVNVVHISSAKGVDAIRTARRYGTKLYAETCPQYLTMTDEFYDRADGNKFVISPPLRKKSDCDELWASIAKGEIDTLGTDHCSFTMKQKNRSEIDFSRTPGGMPGVQHRAKLFYTYGIDSGRASLTDMLALMCERPAKLFGMYPEKGKIAEGSDADLVVWNPDITETVTVENSAYNTDYSPYEGMELKGRAEYVILNGDTAVEKGEQVLFSRGQFVHRGKSNFFRD